MQISRLFILFVFLLSPAVVLALMPPHVDGTNIKKGALFGHTLVLHGYSLKYTKVQKDLSLTDVKTKKAVRWTHKMDCQWEGDCDTDRPGSCQQRCTLTVTLEKATVGSTLKLQYLDVNQIFTLKTPQKN